MVPNVHPPPAMAVVDIARVAVVVAVAVASLGVVIRNAKYVMLSKPKPPP